MVLSAEGERFLPYATTIANAYAEYFESKKPKSNIVDFYTTPTLANWVTPLQGSVLSEFHYISMQSRSVGDLRNMLQKNMPGVYLLMEKQEDIQKLKLKEYTTILQNNENRTICHKDFPITKEELQSKSVPIITYDHYEGNYGNFLRMSDVAQIKALLRQGKAVFNCLEYQYNVNFRGDDEWLVVSKKPVPLFELLLIFSGDIADSVKIELIETVKNIFLK